MTTQQIYIDNMQAKIEAREKEIADLKSKAESAGAVSKMEIEKDIAELALKQAIVRKALGELKAAGENRWERFQNSVEHAWKDMDEAYREALINYK